MEQQSQAWLEWRKLGIGGSDIAAVLGISPYKTKYRLWQEKRGLVKEDNKPNWAMQRGNQCEPKARAHAEFELGKVFPPNLKEHPTKPWFRVSMDGDCETHREALEIKVASKELLLSVRELGSDGIPDYYMAQCQLQLFVTGYGVNNFFVFNEKLNETSKAIVLPNKDWFDRIEKEGDDFWDCVKTGREPALDDRDYILLDDRAFLDAAEDYRKITKEIELLEANLERAKKHILEQAKVHPAIRGGGLKVTGYSVKGNVDYSIIPELKDLDLDPYRKASRKQFKITIEKAKEDDKA